MSTYSVQDIFFSCSETMYFSMEHLVSEHGIAHVFSGELRVSETDREYVLRAGDSVLFCRNRLARMTKWPEPDGRPYRSVAICFRQDFLREYYAAHPHPALPACPDPLLLRPAPLLESLFQSLLPYEQLDTGMPEALVGLKLAEAMTIVRTQEPRADGILANFSDPGKIDLSDFMTKNYAFNIPLERFAYLTGRSLATFKRDFRKVFQTSPQKWLLRRRLQQAHYLIAEKKVRPSDAYLEVGFENLSHFSFAFKQQYGYNASNLQGRP